MDTAAVVPDPPMHVFGVVLDAMAQAVEYGCPSYRR